jgi:hypothetical protein
MLDAVVVYWEDQYDQYLGHIHKNIQNGSATDEEISQLRNLENTVTLYDLMMQNHIEDCGSLSLAAEGLEISKEKGLEILIDRITRSSDMDPDRLKATLQQVVEDRNLKLNHKGDELRWEWESA